MTRKTDANPVVELARENLMKFFEKVKSGEATSIDIAAARIAGSVMATDARDRQSAGAADALNFMIAKELASDKQQLERFLIAAMPSVPIVRALPKTVS